MKFGKKYDRYMEVRRELPAMDIKKMKKTMKRCRKKWHSSESSSSNQKMKERLYEEEEEEEEEEEVDAMVFDSSDDHEMVAACSDDHCPVCDETFFPSLQKEMSIVVGCFNEKAKKLVELHLATGFQRFILWLKGKNKQQKHHDSLIRQGKDLVNYAIINSMAMRKILKKYDKIHRSRQGQAFKMQIQIMHIEILRSPWLCELLAFCINNKGDGSSSLGNNIHGLHEDLSLTFEGSNKPSLTCGLFDSFSVNVDLTCSICLDTVFDPISLACGHIFCYICACGASSVTIIDGPKAADAKSKCPLCRQEGVYRDYVQLTELNILLRDNCHEYWEKRLQSERADRLQQAKEYWEDQCRNIIGI